MAFNLQLGAEVENPNGDALGKIKFLVADPKTDQVTHLVVEEGALHKRQVLIDIGRVRGTSYDGKVVEVDLTIEQFKQNPDFIERQYSNMGINSSSNSGRNEVVSGNYSSSAFPGLNTSGFGSYIYPVGPTEAIDNTFSGSYGGSSSGYGNAPLETGTNLPFETLNEDTVGGAPYTEKMNVPEDSIIIREGAQVEAIDGTLGKVKDVSFEPQSSRIASFRVEKGLFFKEDFTVPINLVESSSEEIVRLNAYLNQLQPTKPNQD